MTADQAKLAGMADGIAQTAIEALNRLEADPAYTARHPEIVDGLAGAIAQLHALKTPIPNYAQILERAARLQARVTIAKARA